MRNNCRNAVKNNSSSNGTFQNKITNCIKNENHYLNDVIFKN